jgi:choline dehydrogenase-like flavoprotein
VIAADPLRTPQLLWNSGIRPAALGRYLNEHPSVTYQIALGSDTMALADTPLPAGYRERALVYAPFEGDAQPFQLQATLALADTSVAPALLKIGALVRQELNQENRLEFSTDRVDVMGMPGVRTVYRRSGRDRRELAAAAERLRRTAESFGVRAESRASDIESMYPAGRSLHLQGTVRCGAAGDDTSVCDDAGRVWGVRGLYVAGTGVIPTETASNPTLYAVALATRTASAILRHL